jgi:hypothetical protein
MAEPSRALPGAARTGPCDESGLGARELDPRKPAEGKTRSLGSVNEEPALEESTMRTDAPQPVIEEIAPDEELLRVDETASIMVRPDGYYWQAEGSRQEFGPFASVEMALAEGQGWGTMSPGALRRPRTIGIADWTTPTPAIRPRISRRRPTEGGAGFSDIFIAS